MFIDLEEEIGEMFDRLSGVPDVFGTDFGESFGLVSRNLAYVKGLLADTAKLDGPARFRARATTSRLFRDPEWVAREQARCRDAYRRRAATTPAETRERKLEERRRVERARRKADNDERDALRAAQVGADAAARKYTRRTRKVASK